MLNSETENFLVIHSPSVLKYKYFLDLKFCLIERVQYRH
jgi:hypothetical protein